MDFAERFMIDPVWLQLLLICSPYPQRKISMHQLSFYVPWPRRECDERTHKKRQPGSRKPSATSSASLVAKHNLLCNKTCDSRPSCISPITTMHLCQMGHLMPCSTCKTALHCGADPPSGRTPPTRSGAAHPSLAHYPVHGIYGASRHRPGSPIGGSYRRLVAAKMV